MERNAPDHTQTALQRMKQIEDCLFEMLLKKPYPSVSVLDICRHLGIARATFYLYYESKDDCFGSIVDHLLREAMIHLNGSIPVSATPLEMYTMMMDFWKEKRQFYDIITANHLDEILMEHSIQFALKEDCLLLMPLAPSERERDTDILACHIASQNALMVQWYRRGFDTPSEEMARKFLRFRTEL